MKIIQKLCENKTLTQEDMDLVKQLYQIAIEGKDTQLTRLEVLRAASNS